jgi:dihydroorotate dehydrogenase
VITHEPLGYRHNSKNYSSCPDMLLTPPRRTSDPAALLEALYGLLAPFWPFGVGDEPILQRRMLGGRFRNPLSVGLTPAGARMARPLALLGFGSIELSVACLDLSGSAADLERLKALTSELRCNSRHDDAVTRVGLVLTATMESFANVSDYAEAIGVAVGEHLADHVTIDLSRGHSAGYSDPALLRQCDRLVAEAIAARDRIQATSDHVVPILLKIVDDIGEPELDVLMSMAVRRGVAGIMVAPVSSAHIDESLAGRPAYSRTTKILAEVAGRVGPGMIIVGEGGVDDVETALGKVSAGADLVIINSAVIAAQPLLLTRIKSALLTAVSAGMNVRELVGLELDGWRAREW